jgi:transposase
MEKYIVTLLEEERKELKDIVRKGSHKSQKVLNALILLNVDVNRPKDAKSKSRSTNESISNHLDISIKKIDRVKKRFVEEGLEIALCGRPKNREYEKKVDGDLEAKLVAISCSEAPDGFSRWSLRMLAEKAVELEYVDSISHETVRRTLKKTN